MGQTEWHRVAEETSISSKMHRCWKLFRTARTPLFGAAACAGTMSVAFANPGSQQRAKEWKTPVAAGPTTPLIDLCVPPAPTAAPDAECTVYRYHSRGEDDYDWGCVYRSAQTVLAAMGEPIPTLVELAQLMGHGPAMEAFLLNPTKEGQRRHLWVEPHDIALALATRSPHLKVRLELFAPSLAGGTVVSRKSYTTGHEANFKVIQDVKQLRAVVQQHLLVHNAPVLIDNGTAAFAIAGMRRNGGNVEYRILDPHYGIYYQKEGYEKRTDKDYKVGDITPYGSDAGKDTWKPASWIEETMGKRQVKTEDEWMMLFVHR